jgi:hypothetical protein
MDVDRAPRIPAGIDRHKLRGARGVGHLVPAQKLVALGPEARVGHIRIDAYRIALPHIHLSTRQRCARAATEAGHGEGQLERHAGLDRPVRGIGPNIGPLEPFVDKVGAFNLLWAHDTGAPHGRCLGWSAPGRVASRQEGDASPREDGQRSAPRHATPVVVMIRGHHGVFLHKRPRAAVWHDRYGDAAHEPVVSCTCIVPSLRACRLTHTASTLLRRAEEVMPLVCRWRVRLCSASASEESRLLCRLHADFHELGDLLRDIV